MKKWLIILTVLVALLAIGLTAAWWWLTDTRSGAEWTLNRAAGQVESLQWDSLEGGFASGLVLGGVELDHDGMHITIEHLELAARVRLLGGISVDVERLHGRGIDVHLPEPEDPPDERPAIDLASPVAINVADGLVEQLRIHPHNAESVLVERIALAGRYADRIDLARLEVVAELGRLTAAGHWSLTEPYGGDLTLTATTPINETTEQSVTLDISGRLASLDIVIQGQGPTNLEGRGRLRDLPQSPSVSIGLHGELSDWPGLDLRVSEIEINAEGNPTDWSATVSAHVEGMDLPPGRWWLAANGDMATINIEELRGEILDGEVLAHGRIDHGAEIFSASTDVQLRRLDLTERYPEWPEQARLTGNLSARVEDDEIHLDSLDITAEPTSLRLTGSGRFLPSADELALDLDWQDFTWPPITDDRRPLLASESGSLRLTGRISDWRLELEALLEAEEMPPAELGLRATGDEHASILERVTLRMQEAGTLDGRGTLAWDPMLETELDIALDGFDPGRFIPELAGRVDARMGLVARHDERWLINLDLSELDGAIRGQSLSGSGRVNIADQRPESGWLEISLGRNHLALDSADGELWTWQFDGEALGQLWPELSGAASLSGSLEPETRQLTASGSADNAGFGDRSLESISIEAEFDWGEQPHAQGHLHLVNLDLNPWDRIDQLELAFSGGCRDHRLELNLASRRASLDLAGTGTLDGCLKQTERWHVHIERFFLDENVAGAWQLTESLAISASGDGIEAGPGCLRAAGDADGRLCLQGLSINRNSSARISVEQFPVDLLLLPIDPVFTLTTPLSGQLEAGWTDEGITRLAGHLALGAGGLRPLDGEHDLLTIESVRLDITPRPDQGLVLDLLARLEGDSELQGQADIFDLRDLASTHIDADARMNLPNIGAFNHFVTELDQLGGRLEGTLSASGALFAPDINGTLSIIDGYLAHAPMGLKVSDIDLDLEGAADHATLRGRMRSGDGTLVLEGVLTQATDAWDMQLDIDGDAFTFADVDWLKLAASPEIRIEGRPGKLHLDGDIHIDRLRGGLPPGTGERVTLSDDVHVIGEEEEDDEPDVPIRQLDGRLGIHLGDDARMSAVGLQTRLAGGVELLWSGNPMPRGQGVIRLPEGSYRAYGQNLDIRDGEVVFTGHPMDNPRLDIRAVRDIFGDPRVDVAGVHIRGTAREPQINLYTRPPTSEEKALAYVITGADFDHAAGRGAVNIGFYLIPRLFVSYGIGLFEAGNVLSGRYELSERWGIRVVSGERDTGVDLGYIRDR